MRIWISLISAMLICVSSAALGGDTTDITGNWKIHTTSHRGYETWETKILLYEGKYEVITVQPHLGRSDCTLSLDGDKIKMVFPFTYGAPGTDTARTTFVLSGTVEGNTMRGFKTTQGTNTHGDDRPVAWVALKNPDTH
jgi:hypothetical protein